MKKETEIYTSTDARANKWPSFPELSDSQFHFTLNNKKQKIKFFGSSSVVYQISDGKNFWAIKYFTTSLLNRWEYLEKVQEKIISLQKDWIIPFIIVDQKDLKLDPKNEHIHPGKVILMPWIEGATLQNLVERHSLKSNKKELIQLHDSFIELIRNHASETFSHGDLSPENIMVTTEGKMIMIDHDTFMFEGWNDTSGQGYWSSSYQHPYRHPQKPDLHADDFSQLLLSICLKALTHHPGLFKMFNSTKGLLFTIDDFKSPEFSGIIQEILTIEDAHLIRMVNLLINHLQKHSTAIPDLVHNLTTKIHAEHSGNTIETENNPLVEKEINELVESKIESERLIQSLNKVVAKEIAIKEKMTKENKRLREELIKTKNWLSFQKHRSKIKIAVISALAIVSISVLSVIALSPNTNKNMVVQPVEKNTIVNNASKELPAVPNNDIKDVSQNEPVIMEQQNDEIVVADTVSEVKQDNYLEDKKAIDSMLKEFKNEVVQNDQQKKKSSNDAIAKVNSASSKKKLTNKPIKKENKDEAMFRQSGF